MHPILRRCGGLLGCLLVAHVGLLAVAPPCTIEPAAAGARPEEAPAHHATAHEGKGASQPTERGPAGSRCCDAMTSCALHLALPANGERLLPTRAVSMPALVARPPHPLPRSPDIPPPKA